MKHGKKQVILLSAHFFNEFIVSQYNKLLLSISENTDLYLLIEYEKDTFVIPENIQYYKFDAESLNKLQYAPISETIVPGSNHFPVLQFYKANPHYDFYWNIEYDVYFNGNWNVLINAFKRIDSDFVSSLLERWGDTPDWMWWNSLKLKTTEIPESRHIKSFNPIYRISNRALSFLDKFLSEGNSGHHEVLIPTVLNHFGYKIMDFGGVGEFVSQGHENAFYLTNPKVRNLNYTGSSMRYRPIYNLNEVELMCKKNYLYHPIKCK